MQAIECARQALVLGNMQRNVQDRRNARQGNVQDKGRGKGGQAKDKGKCKEGQCQGQAKVKRKTSCRIGVHADTHVNAPDVRCDPM